MKKNFLYFIAATLLLFTANAAFAQIGLKGGISLASLAEEAFSESSEEYDAKSYTGFQGGLFFELPVGEGFAIQPELLFIQKGGKLQGTVGETIIKYNYIEVPVLAKIKAGSTDGSGIGLFFYGGPFVSYALNGKFENTIGGTETKFDIEFDDEDNQRRVDWGVAFGLGVNLGALALDLRYDLGINNLLDADATSGNNGKDPYLRTRSIGLTLGYVLGGGN